MRLRFSIRVKQAPAEAGTVTSADATAEHAIELPAATAIIIGRNPRADIQLPFASVSAEHARMVRSNGAWYVEDLGSAGGTFLGGRRLEARERSALLVGDVLVIGGAEVRFEGEAPATDAVAAPSTTTLARRLVYDLFRATTPAECPKLVVTAGPALGKELLLSQPGRCVKVGRGDCCDLLLPDNDMSREHASFERSSDGILVRDLGAKNGVVIAGKRLRGEQIVRDGEVVVLGRTHLQVFDPEERYLREMESVKREPVTSSAVAPTAEMSVDQPRLPRLAATIAATTLLLSLGLVLALVFFTKM